MVPITPLTKRVGAFPERRLVGWVVDSGFDLASDDVARVAGPE